MSNVPISSPYGNYSISFQNNKKHGIVEKSATLAKGKNTKKDYFVTALKDSLEKDSNSSFYENDKNDKNEKESKEQETIPSNEINYFTYNKEGKEAEYLKKSTFDHLC